MSKGVLPAVSISHGVFSFSAGDGGGSCNAARLGPLPADFTCACRHQASQHEPDGECLMWGCNCSGYARATLARPALSLPRQVAKRVQTWFARTPEQRYLIHLTHKLAAGAAHSTLGDNIRDETYTRMKAEQWAERMIGYGLQPDHLCVEYGCGSLWAAEPIIRRLGPGRYIGLDITDQFYEVGRARLGGLLRDKQVRLGVISDAKIAEVAAFAPDFIYSRKVLPHVDGAALPRYMANIAALMAPKTIAVLDNTPVLRDGRRTGRRHAVEAMRKWLPAGFEIEQAQFGALLRRRR